MPVSCSTLAIAPAKQKSVRSQGCLRTADGLSDHRRGAGCFFHEKSLRAPWCAPWPDDEYFCCQIRVLHLLLRRPSRKAHVPRVVCAQQIDSVAIGIVLARTAGSTVWYDLPPLFIPARLGT